MGPCGSRYIIGAELRAEIGRLALAAFTGRGESSRCSAREWLRDAQMTLSYAARPASSQQLQVLHLHL